MTNIVIGKWYSGKYISTIFVGWHSFNTLSVDVSIRGIHLAIYKDFSLNFDDTYKIPWTKCIQLT